MNGIGRAKIIALDSNIFIYNLEQNPDYVSQTDKIFKQLISKKIKAVTSIISMIELLSYPATENVADQLTEDFTNTPNLTVFEINQGIALETARIRREHRFRLADAIQLATAILSKAKVFVTNDESIKRFKEIKVLMLKDI